MSLTDQAPSEFWYEFSGGAFIRQLVRAARERLVEITPTGLGYNQHASLLYEDGIDAFNGAFAAALADLVRVDRNLISAAETVRAFGGGVVTPLGFTQEFDALEDGPFKPFETASFTPSAAITITDAFADRRGDHRRQILDILARLSETWDVTLVADSVITETWFRTTHAADVPGVSPRCTDGPEHRSPVEAAARTVGATDLRGRVLEELVTAETDERAYYELYSAFPGHSEGRIRQVITADDDSLTDLGLATTYQRADGMVAAATETGREFYSTHIAPQTTLDAGFGSPEDRVSSDPNSLYNTVCSGGTSGEGEEAGASDRTADRPAPLVGWAPKWEHFAVAAGAPDGGFALLDHDLPKWDRGDRGWPGSKVSWDGTHEQAVICTEHTGVLQYQVSTALALTGPKLRSRIFADHRLDDGEFGELLNERIEVLRDIMCIGWLPDSVSSAEEFRDEIEAARKRLREMTLRLGQGDVDDEAEFRGSIIRLALGLSGTVVHVADIAGVDIVHEVRLPEFSDGFSTAHHHDRRMHLAKTLANAACIQSRIGERHAAERQMFETRQRKREAALGYEADAADPFGECLSSFVLVGDGVEAFTDDLRTALQSRKRHEDAPDASISIPVRPGERGVWTNNVAARVAADKRIRPTTEAVSVLRALTGSAYDVARGLVRGLSDEDDPGRMERDRTERDLRADEVHRCIAALPPGRILPTLSTPTVGKMVHALCREQRALTTSELADAAGISTQSIRNNRDALEALGLVEEVDAGWRMALTFSDEHGDRYPEPVADGWLIQDAYWALAVAFLDDGESVAETDDPVIDVLAGGGPPTPDELRSAASWDGGWAPVLRQLVAHDRQVRDHGLVADPDPIHVGGDPEQQPLPGVGA